MVNNVLLGAYALIWLAVSVEMFWSELKMYLKDDSEKNEEVKRMADDSATESKELMELIAGRFSPSILAFIMLVLPIILMAFDLGGFAVAAMVMHFTSALNIIYWIALAATVVVYVKLIHETAKITAEIAQDEDPAYVERVTREVMADSPVVTPFSFTSALGKVILAALAVMEVFFL